MANKEEELDRVFSIFIRLSHASHEGYVFCFTCEIQLPWQEAQNGHWKRRAFHATRWHKDNCRPQCPSCNMDRGGMEESFEEHLREELGDEAVEAIEALSRTNKSYSDEELEELISRYKVLVRKLGVII